MCISDSQTNMADLSCDGKRVVKITVKAVEAVKAECKAVKRSLRKFSEIQCKSV